MEIAKGQLWERTSEKVRETGKNSKRKWERKIDRESGGGGGGGNELTPTLQH